MKTAYCPQQGTHDLFYISAMFGLTKSALTSANRVEAVVQQQYNGCPDYDGEGALNELQNIVRQAGALSRYFWPVRKAHNDRGTYLRRALRVNDASPLKTRNVRNRMEHFDEELDKYLSKRTSVAIMPSYFAPEQLFPFDDYKDKYQAYYTDSCTFEILGERIEMRPLIQEILRVHEQLNECLRNGMCF